MTSSFGKFISEVKPQHLSPTVLHRSKRMVLDSIGVGLVGSTTEVFELALQHCKVMSHLNPGSLRALCSSVGPRKKYSWRHA